MIEWILYDLQANKQEITFQSILRYIFFKSLIIQRLFTYLGYILKGFLRFHSRIFLQKQQKLLWWLKSIIWNITVKNSPTMKHSPAICIYLFLTKYIHPCPDPSHLSCQFFQRLMIQKHRISIHLYQPKIVFCVWHLCFCGW